MTKIKSQLRTLSPAELATKAKDLRLQIFRAQLETNPPKTRNTRLAHSLRRQLSIVLNYLKKA